MKNPTVSRVSLAGVASIVLAANAASAESFRLYGSQVSSDFGSVPGLVEYSTNPVNGTSTRIGSAGTLIDMDFSASGTLYAAKLFSGLVTVNTTTGAAALIGDWGLGANRIMSGLTFAPDGTLYGNSNNSIGQSPQLHAINPTTGAATLVGSMGTESVGAIEFGPDGTLYASRRDGIYTVNRTSGALVSKVVSISGNPNEFVFGLDYGADGVFRMILSDVSFGTADRLFSINLGAGTTTFLGNASEVEARGLASIPAPPMLTLVGLAGLGACRRRHR